MAIETTFAIHAAPREIFAALQRDVASASEHGDGTFQVIATEPDRKLQLRVTIGAVPCYLTYVIEQKSDCSEVTATLVPFGWRYSLFKIGTLGMRDQNFTITLVEGLANLKAELEGGE
jgi:hypothetical protein